MLNNLATCGPTKIGILISDSTVSKMENKEKCEIKATICFKNGDAICMEEGYNPTTTGNINIH